MDTTCRQIRKVPGTVCREAVVSLGATEHAPSESRRFLASVLASWGLRTGDVASATASDAELALSELVTNSVRHAGPGEIRVHVDAHGDSLVVDVEDDSPAVPRAPGAVVADEGGRGLLIVSALGRWGVDPSDRGKRVWARFDVPVGSALALGCTHRGAGEG